MNPRAGALPAVDQGATGKGQPQGLFLFAADAASQPVVENAPGRRATPLGRGIRKGILLLFAALLLAGCGYRFAKEEGPVAPALRTVFVDTFTNRTSEAHAENIFRSAFISRFVQEGRFKLARNRGEADLICRGSIRSLQAAPLAYKTTNLSAEDRITVTLEIFFEERESGRVIWTESSFVGTGEYPVTTIGATASSRRSALVKLAGDSAERAYRLMMSGF